ncbi:MAG: DUF1292 domain-containing protein [Roseburia sp.]|nr:DUF1292 domain-containing protein [Roseburia sp.]MCM1279638.1 DUF1292 domain-containing protein [Robinsoniella sp.]
MGNQNNSDGISDEEMSVTIELDDGTEVNCAIITILTVEKQDYIVLLPLDENDENEDGEVWIYRYFEDENDENAEPVLECIEDDDEFERAAEAYDEYLDAAEFDEIISDSDLEADIEQMMDDLGI